MAEPQIAQADLIEYLQLLGDLRNIGEEQQGFADGHVEHLIDVLALVENFEDAALVSRAFAFFADQFDVGEKLHLDGNGSIALADFAAAAGNIERKAAGVVAARLRFACRGENIANVIECFDVGDRIRSRRSADRALIDENDIRNPFHSGFDRLPCPVPGSPPCSAAFIASNRHS